VTAHIGSDTVEYDLLAAAVMAFHLEESTAGSWYDRHDSALQFKLLGPDVRAMVCLLTGLAAVAQVYTPGWFLPAFGLRAWKAPVSGHDLAEASLSPFEFRGFLFLDSLDLYGTVLLAEWTICFYVGRHFH